MDAAQLYRMLVFATVVEKGSLTAAAQSLGVGRSMVSQHLKRLEHHLGSRLLERTTRRLALTVAGKTYFRCCAELLLLAQQAEAQQALEPQQLFGRLTLAVPADLAQLLILPILQQFHQRYPHLHYNLQLQLANATSENSRVDLQLLCQTASASEPQDGMGLAHFQQWLVAAPSLLEQHGNPAHPDHLQQLPWLGNNIAEPQTLNISDSHGDSFTIRYTPQFCSNSLMALQQMAVQGLGVTVLPDYLLQTALAAGQLRRLLPGWTFADGEICAHHPYGDNVPPRVDALLGFLRQNLQQACP